MTFRLRQSDSLRSRVNRVRTGINPYAGGDRGIVSRSRQFTVDQPALNIGAAPRRIGGDGDPGMRSVRPTDDSSVSCRDSLATRERAHSKFLRPRLYAVDSSLSFFSFFFFLFLFLSFSPFFFCRSFTRTRSRPRRSHACDALLRHRLPEPAARVLRLWRFRGSVEDPG